MGLVPQRLSEIYLLYYMVCYNLCSKIFQDSKKYSNHFRTNIIKTTHSVRPNGSKQASGRHFGQCNGVKVVMKLHCFFFVHVQEELFCIPLCQHDSNYVSRQLHYCPIHLDFIFEKSSLKNQVQ